VPSRIRGIGGGRASPSPLVGEVRCGERPATRPPPPTPSHKGRGHPPRLACAGPARPSATAASRSGGGRGAAAEQALCEAFDEARHPRAGCLEIVRGKGTGQLKRTVQPFLERPRNRSIIRKIDHDARNRAAGARLFSLGLVTLGVQPAAASLTLQATLRPRAAHAARSSAVGEQLASTTGSTRFHLQASTISRMVLTPPPDQP